MIRLVCILIGYIFGCFQTAYIYGKMHGIDIREHGSGNAGTTNSLRVLGKKAGAIVLICDILKTGLAIIFVRIACFKNLIPSPAPVDAPSINPGRSAITNERRSFSLTNPKLGESVVK